MSIDTVVLDLDGTLVDSVYVHVTCWKSALADVGVEVSSYRIHRAIGMGGDHLVAALCGDEVEERKGEDIRVSEKERYAELIGEVQPFAGARELIADLKDRGHAVVLASSAKSDEVDHYLDLLDARDLVDAWTDSSDVEATKPEPDLVHAAIDKAGGGDAVMVGDSTWDCEAAGRAGIETVAALTGGFSEAELREAGAVAVFESIEELRERVGQTPLGDGQATRELPRQA